MNTTSRCRWLLAAGLWLITATGASADTQRLSVRAGWNLVSIAIVPDNPAPGALFAPLGANLEALWSYDATTDSWFRFPQATPGTTPITAIESGRGYWLKSSATANFDIVGADDATPAAPGQLTSDWNLVGFPLTEATPYERVITNSAVRQIWTFDAVAQAFQGIVIDNQGLVTREDFIDLEPGRGYWLLSNAATSIAPELLSTLPSDVDVPPILATASVETAVPWTNISQGDVDVARDGNYNRSLTQRAVDFEDRIFQQQLTLGNSGSGVLVYTVEVEDPVACQWLRILETDRSTGETTRVSQSSGSVSSERVRVELIALREGLAIGEYQCDFIARSNGAGPDDAARRFTAYMEVGDLIGDYRLRVELDSVDGKRADLANPRIGLSLYRDSDGLKAVIDPQNSLLFPSKVRLAGRLIESSTTRFEVSGSFEVAAGLLGNPFGTSVRRDITLRGERQDRVAADGTIIGSPDLNGEYFEIVRNVTPEPISLRGSFSGERRSSVATARDAISPEDTTAAGLPDNATFERVLNVTDGLLIDEVDVTVNLAHDRPTDLVVTLISPAATEVILRSRSGASLGEQRYDELAVPLESLAAFEGEDAEGAWTLRIEDQVGGVSGNLLGWSLDLRGTPVFAVSGNVGAQDLATAIVVLTGCGRTEVAELVGPDFGFRFEGLVDCPYRLGVYNVESTGGQPLNSSVFDVVVSGRDVQGFMPFAQTIVTRSPRDQTLPSSPQGRFVSLTTSGGAGALQPQATLQYAFDTATYDLDRPPLGVAPGPEDTDAFLGVENVVGGTGSNAPGDNSVLDGPVGANSYRATLNLGLPVIGRSVQGNLRLSVGANP